MSVYSKGETRVEINGATIALFVGGLMVSNRSVTSDDVVGDVVRDVLAEGVEFEKRRDDIVSREEKLLANKADAILTKRGFVKEP